MKAIILISGLPTEEQEAHARLLTGAYPSLRVITDEIKGFLGWIYNRALVDQAASAILNVAETLAVSCADDPGVTALRQRYVCPVVGTRSCLASACLALGAKLGVLTITENLLTPLRQVLEATPPVWQHVPKVRNTTDLSLVWEAILQTATTLVAQGCTALALACTGFSTIGASAWLRQQLSVSVLNPV